MEAVPFNKAKHKEQFASWCKARKMAVDEPTMMDYLPDEGGFIVEDHACVFVYQTGTRMAYLDMMMNNPNKTTEARHVAGKLVIDAAMQFAREKNIHMYSFCTDNSAIHKYMNYAGSFKLSDKPYEQWYWINKEFKPPYQCACKGIGCFWCGR
jgi:hypothetical protein